MIAEVLFVAVMVGRGAVSLAQVRPTIVPVKVPENLSEGNRLSIMCSVTSGSPPISFVWHKDGKPIGNFLGVKVNHIDDFQDVLQIEKLSGDHVGNYTCNAKNMYGADHITIPVLLSFAPRWLVADTLDAKSFESGQTVTVDCRTTGHPLPTLRISRGNKEVDLNQRVRMVNGILTLNDVTMDDRGEYSCEAENPSGKISKTVTVTLSGEYPFPIGADNSEENQTESKNNAEVKKCHGESSKNQETSIVSGKMS